MQWNPRAKDWRWEVNLIGSKQINAFCMPGGKIVFYSGILDQLKLTDDDFKTIQPTLIIDSVEWDGPIVDSWPTAAHQRSFSSKDAREIVHVSPARARYPQIP